MEGRVKFFNKIKGFGFIEGEDGRDYFVHISDVEGKSYLNDGDSVSFEGAEDSKGLKAAKVQKTGDAPDEQQEEVQEAQADDAPSEEQEETPEEQPGDTSEEKQPEDEEEKQE